MTNDGDRLPAHNSQRVNQGSALTFYFEGRPVAALTGDTVASALLAKGRTIFSRTFKYHRPRGLLCCSGRVPPLVSALFPHGSSLIQVSGIWRELRLEITATPSSGMLS
jgi:hypothetical protein